MLLIAIVIAIFPLLGVSDANEKVLLSDVQVLTLHKGQYTTGRRAPPVLQLKCVGGSAAKSSYHPEVAQCYNRGSNGINAQWECKADLDNAVRFGKINVYCEGYNYPDDPYILKDSCGLEYHLEYANAGSRQGQSSYKSDESVSDSGNAFVAIVIICAIIFIYLTCIRRSGDNQPRNGGQSRFHGGGPPPPPYGGPPPPYDDRPSAPPPDDSAPPPYGFRSDHYSQKQQGASAGTSGYRQQEYQQQHAPTGAAAGAAGQGGPGFWAGLGAGGLLGYLFGRNAGERPYYGRENMWYQPTYAQPGPSNTDRDSFGFFRSGTTGTSGGRSGLGTRSASGYGETRRR